MGNSVGPLAVGVQASVGDFAGPVRAALQGAATAVRQFRTPASAADALFGSSKQTSKQFEAEVARRSTAWQAAMGDVRRQRAGAFGQNMYDTLAFNSLARMDPPAYGQSVIRSRRRELLRFEKSGELGGMWDSPAASTVSASALASGVASVPGTGRAGSLFSTRGLRGLVPPMVLRGLNVLSNNPALIPLAAVAAASHVGGLHRQEGIAGAQVGMTGAQYSAMERRAYWSKASMDSVAAGVHTMRGLMGEGAAGGPRYREQSDVVAELGISGLSAQDALERMADTLRSTKDPVERLGLAIRAFGENAVDVEKSLPKGRTEIPTGMIGFGEITRAGAVGTENVNSLINSAGTGLKNSIDFVVGGSIQGAQAGTRAGLHFLTGGRYGTSYQQQGEEMFAPQRLAQEEADRRDEVARLMPLKKAISSQMAGNLLSPREKLENALSDLQEGRKFGFYGPGERGNTMAARAAGLAADEYVNAIPKSGGLSGAATTGSVQGYSQIVEAIYARETAADAVRQSNTILSDILGVNREFLNEVRNQRGFQNRVNEGP